MADPDHLRLFRERDSDRARWLNFRILHESLDLSGADLSQDKNLQGIEFNKADLRGVKFFNGVDLQEAHLTEAKLTNVNLQRAHLEGAELGGAHLQNANLEGAHLEKAKLGGAHLRNVNLTNAYLTGADLTEIELDSANLAEAHFDETILLRANLRRVYAPAASFGKANLSQAMLRAAYLYSAKLSGAILVDADLSQATLVEASLDGTDLTGARIYGVSAWDLKLNDDTKQKSMKISTPSGSVFTVDDLEVAQFIYLLLNRKKFRNVIQNLVQKAVLILGRFTPERKEILDAIAERLRQLGYLPIIFDFQPSIERDLAETIKILASLSLFVIADITNPRSSPLELQATVPDYMVPFVPIVQKGEEPFSMFKSLKIQHQWVLDIIRYDSKEQLLTHLNEKIIKPAIQKHNDLVDARAAELKIIDLD